MHRENNPATLMPKRSDWSHYGLVNSEFQKLLKGWSISETPGTVNSESPSRATQEAYQAQNLEIQRIFKTEAETKSQTLESSLAE